MDILRENTLAIKHDWSNFKAFDADASSLLLPLKPYSNHPRIKMMRFGLIVG